MKKIWNILLCAALLCALCACGQSPAADAQDAGKPEAQSQPAPREAEPPQETEAPEEETGEDLPELAVAPNPGPSETSGETAQMELSLIHI